MNNDELKRVSNEYVEFWNTAKKLADRDYPSPSILDIDKKDESREKHLLGMIEMYCTRYGEPRQYREALEDMVFQFGHRGVKNKKPMIWTGGLSALESAFEVLGWDDPHYLPEEGYTCEVVGCMEPDTAGTHWGDNKLYLRLCHKHFTDSISGKPMPEIKKWALEREAKRDPNTRILPLER